MHIPNLEKGRSGDGTAAIRGGSVPFVWEKLGLC